MIDRAELTTKIKPHRRKRVNTSIYIRPIFGNKQRFMRKLLVKFFQFLFKSAQITTIPSIIKIKSQ